MNHEYQGEHDYTRWETYANWPDHWFGIEKDDMIKKHPQGRAERMMINEKKKKDKGKRIQGLSDRPPESISSDTEEWREDS